MADAGFSRGQPRDSGVLLLFSGETRHCIFVAQVGGKTAIILARSG